MDCKKLQKITRIVNTPYLKSAELPKFFAALNEPLFEKLYRNRDIENFFSVLCNYLKEVCLNSLSPSIQISLVILSEKPLLTKLTVADTL